MLPLSLLSRPIRVVLPPVGHRVPVPRSVLNPSAPVFCPRADRIPPSSTVRPNVIVSRPPAAQDDTLLKTRMGYASVFSMESADLSVPPHLQNLFNKSVTQGDLAPSHQRSLAALMRRHSDAFATGPMDLVLWTWGFAMY